MNKHIYSKLAVSNIFKNAKIYLPYLFTVLASMMIYFLIGSIGSNPNIYSLDEQREAFKGAMTLCGIIQSGTFLMSLFIFVFLLYANSFVLKHQKKQFGLYLALGMERKHIVKIIFIEEITILGVGLVAGLGIGILLDKLMLALLFKIIGQATPSGFFLNVQSILQTCLLAAIIFALILIFNVLSILLMKDIDLLKSEKMGEKEPKNKPVVTLVGISLLVWGYGKALGTTGAGTAINDFFPAALLVMAATYLLFTAGSITLLKLLKKNKGYYYQTKHFISVSDMLYRMKQNAAGLATICILSTATIIVLSAGVSLYANGERGINEQFPRQVIFYVDDAVGEMTGETLDEELSAGEFRAENIEHCTFASQVFTKTEDGISIETGNVDFETDLDTYILTLEEYNRVSGTNETLNEGEILLYSSDGSGKQDTLNFAGNTYIVKGEAKTTSLKYIQISSMALFSKLLIVVENEAVRDSFMGENGDDIVTWMGFDSQEENIEKVAEFVERVCVRFAEKGMDYQVLIKQQEEEYFYSMYGGILFVGGILGILFILCTMMIIYYKQVSEGYEDRERFHIMQKVGLSKDEIKEVIHAQVMLVFFLPLITAIIHASVASKIVAKCLQMVVIVHVPTFAMSVAGICLLFALVYSIVYKITSKEYYGIVNY